MMYKATIRNIWNKNIAQYFFMIKREKMLEKNLINHPINLEIPDLSPTMSPLNNIQRFLMIKNCFFYLIFIVNLSNFYCKLILLHFLTFLS